MSVSVCGCVNACRCVLGVRVRIACVSVCVHTHGSWGRGDGRGQGRRGEGEAQLTDAEFCFDWSPAAHSSWTRGAGSRVGSERREMTRSEFCLDERKFFAQGNSPPGVCPPL